MKNGPLHVISNDSLRWIILESDHSLPQKKKALAELEQRKYSLGWECGIGEGAEEERQKNDADY